MSLDMGKFNFNTMFCSLHSLIKWIFLYWFKFLINYELNKTSVWIFKYDEFWLNEHFAKWEQKEALIENYEKSFLMPKVWCGIVRLPF